jgi:hypothetical protein
MVKNKSQKLLSHGSGAPFRVFTIRAPLPGLGFLIFGVSYYHTVALARALQK